MARTGEVNATEALNKLLEKHTVRYVGSTSTVSFDLLDVTDRIRWPRPSPPPPPPAPPSAPPPEFWAAARVRDSFVVSAERLVFDKAKMAQLPTEAILIQKSLENCGNANFSQDITLSVATTKGSTVEKSTGLTTTNEVSLGGSISVPIPVVPSVDAHVSWNQVVSSSTTRSERVESTGSVQDTTHVSLEPYTAVKLYLLVYKVSVEIPFKANVTVDGNLAENASGLKLASQLLSVADRTFPVEGSLRISDAIAGKIRTEDVSCDALGTAADEPQMEIPLSGISDTFMSGFVLASSASDGEEPAEAADRDFPEQNLDGSAGGPKIGPPDGTHYTVLFTREIIRATPACGYNDVGLPIAGIYVVETRKYSTYKDGKLTRQWTKNVETFKRCHHP